MLGSESQGLRPGPQGLMGRVHFRFCLIVRWVLSVGLGAGPAFKLFCPDVSKKVCDARLATNRSLYHSNSRIGLWRPASHLRTKMEGEEYMDFFNRWLHRISRILAGLGYEGIKQAIPVVLRPKRKSSAHSL